VLRGYAATDDTWPTEWTPRKREAALAKYADYLDSEVGNL
jgi:acyl-CoA dehydrogenase